MTFFFTLLFMFMVFWRPQDWLVTALYGWPVLDVVVSVAMLSLVLEVDQGSLRFPRRVPQVYILIGLWFATLMSHVPSTYFGGLMATLPETFKVCFYTLLLICALDRPARIRTVARMLVVMSLFMSVHAILQHEREYGFGPILPMYVPAYLGKSAEIRTRFYGIFNDPNDMAQMFAASVPLSFVLFRRGGFFSFLVGVACSVVLGFALWTTHSDGGLVSLVVVLGIMVISWFPARWSPRLMILAIVGGLALCPLSSAFMDVAAHERVIYWGLANEVFKSNMLFGIGEGMFWQVAKSRASHNAFVCCYTELGLFGYWFWFSLLVLGILGCWRVRRLLAGRRDGEARWLYRFSAMALAAVTGFAASSYFLSRTFVYPFFFLFGVLAALPRVTEDHLPEVTEPIVKLDSPTVLFLTLGSVGSVIYIYISILLLNKAWYG